MNGEWAGALNERVVIEARAGNRNAYAGASGAYAYIGEAWAAITPLVPADLTLADALSAMPRWQVRMRKREGIDPRVRFTWRGRYLAVRTVVSDPREPAQMTITCEEVR
jgi:head-tail adaptor